MITSTIYAEEKKENTCIKTALKDTAAKLTEDDWSIRSFEKLSEFKDFLKDHPLIDMNCYEISGRDALECLALFRKDYKEAFVLLVADASLNPMLYLNPGIRPDSLLLRPYDEVMLKEKLSEMISVRLSKDKKDNENVFFYEDREGRLSIPYRDIYYMESREKKIFVRTLNDEYGIYHTLDQLEQELPKNFVRCHRSFIVNKDKISDVFLSQNIIILKDEFDVPLSRSYKPALKGWKRNRA